MTNPRHSPGKLTPAQVRAARALLRWSQKQLADRSGVHVNPIKLFEAERSNPLHTTLDALEKAFRKAGVEFVAPAEGKGPGLRFAKAPPAAAARKTGALPR